MLLALLACAKAPVEWSPIQYTNAPQEPLDRIANPVSPRACPVSTRAASLGNIRFATWWEVRPDSSAVLMASRDSNIVIADSTDHSTAGCGRPAPAITTDSVTGYVHIAYFAGPASGAGIFFAHSMDSAKTFHSPVPVVFGRNPARVSVASSGDRVVVAYEDPNANQPSIGVALSSTMGHIFERRITASGENGIARQPVVRLHGDLIQVWWSEYSPIATVSATRPRYREGKWTH
jgi:hypothetical protein